MITYLDDEAVEEMYGIKGITIMLDDSDYPSIVLVHHPIYFEYVAVA